MNKKLKILNNNKILNYYQLNKFYYKSLKQLPYIHKLTISFDQKTNDLKQIAASHLAIKILFFQKGTTTVLNKSNVIYKTKKGRPVGCKITVNNKTKIIENITTIFNILISNDTMINLKLNKNNFNALNLNVFEIYRFKKLENYFLLLNQLKKLNVSFEIFSKAKSNNIEIKYLLKNFYFIMHL